MTKPFKCIHKLSKYWAKSELCPYLKQYWEDVGLTFLQVTRFPTGTGSDAYVVPFATVAIVSVLATHVLEIKQSVKRQ